MKATTAWMLVVVGFIAGIVFDYAVLGRRQVRVEPTVVASSSSEAPDPGRMDWKFEYDDCPTMFSSDTPDCLPLPSRKPPSETRGGCVVEPRMSTLRMPSFTCGDWTVELIDVHPRAGFASVDARMKYAGSAGDIGVCSLACRGTATAIR